MTKPAASELRAWAARLGDPDEATRIEAQVVLLAHAEDALPYVLQVFASGSTDTRREAVWFLAHALLEGDEVRAALRHAAEDASLDVRELGVVAQERLDDPSRWEAELMEQFAYLQTLGADGLTPDD